MNVKKSRPKSGRILILIALLVAAALLCFLPRTAPTVDAPSSTAAPSNDTASSEPFSRSAREAAYDKDVAALRSIVESDDCDAETRKDAATRLTRLIGEHQTELDVGAAIEEAGFRPSLTLCENGALTVMLDKERLSAEESAVILSLCAAHANVGAENIRLMLSAR